MAAGKVITGFSKPYVALYAAEGTTVTYSQGRILARGVEVSLDVEFGDSNIFYADNVEAENIGGVFQSGELTLTVDGLFIEAQALIEGFTAAESGWTNIGGNEAPYVGVAFVVRYMSGGVTYYTPVVLPKARFNPAGLEAATQEEEIDWQTTELTATVTRSDEDGQTWKKIGADQTTEAAAEGEIRTLFGISG